MRKYSKIRQKERKGGNFRQGHRKNTGKLTYRKKSWKFSPGALKKYRKFNGKKEKLEISASGTDRIQDSINVKKIRWKSPPGYTEKMQ